MQAQVSIAATSPDLPLAQAKHYILNEQEHFRQSFEWGLPNAMSSNIDDRTLHELYLWPFADSIKAGVASVMCSYQMVNNSYVFLSPPSDGSADLILDMPVETASSSMAY